MTDMNKPAFPHLNPNFDGNWDKEPQRAGMTLHEWFAGQAMSGWLASFEAGDVPNPTHIASLSYDIADAMLAEKDRRDDR
jgi:hypothetical protein